jgi:cytochrome oxidase Cu insertion factor (SCO1/SenC/PrrC family)
MHSPDRARFAVQTSLTQAVVLLVAACGSQAATPPNAGPSHDAVQVSAQGPKVHFEYTALDGTPLSTSALAGRISVIGFATTYDPASQAQARFLTVLLRRHTPRLNVALLVLEPPENQILVETFAQSLRLPYPVALADAATIAGQGPFTGLHHVPSVVILDAEGREAYRYLGLLDDTALDKVVRAVEALRKAPR